MTFSIVAHCPESDSWGVAVASKFLAVGSAVPAAIAGVGALATQAWANTGYKGQGLAFMDQGASAGQALQQLLAADADRDHRQVGIVDSTGQSASHTGAACLDWAGGVTGPGYAIQGNILVGPQVVDAIEQAWLTGSGQPIADRLLAALAAGDGAGGDRRGRQSAALLVVCAGAGYGGFDDVAVDLRVDDHTDPVLELGRLLDLNDLYLTATADADKVEIDDALREEIESLARAAGAIDFAAWVGTENYEMRVAEDFTWIDRRILGIIRGHQE
ncbi:MAG: DUF1028 domain-containing protein [Nocardioides sp.]